MPQQPSNDIVKFVIDNNDDSIKYSKGWHIEGAPKVHYTKQSAATASFSFNGSFVAVFGVVPSYNGFPALGLNATTVLRSSYQINDGPPEFFNTTLTAERLTDQVFFQPSTSTLVDGPHTLVITNLGGPLMLDYLTMVPQSLDSSLSTTSSMNYHQIWKIDDTSTNITYNNAQALSDTNQADYNSTLHSLSHPQSTAFVNFNGDFVAVYGALPEVGPLPDVSFTLDNVIQPVPSGQSDPQSSILPLPTARKRRISQVLFWESSILDDIPHNLSITTRQGEFLLDFILVRTRSTDSLSLSPQPTNHWLGCVANCASSTFHPKATPNSTPPTLHPSSDPGNISAIVGGVLGTVSIVLLFCIVYLLSKRRPYLRFPIRSNSKPSDQTSNPPTSSRTEVARDGAQPRPVDGSGRPVKSYIPGSSVAWSHPPSYRSRSEVHNGQDLHVAKKKGEVMYGHDEKFAMFRQL